MLRDWRNKLSSDIENRLNKLLKGIKIHQEAYFSSRNPVIAQIWVGLAELQNKIDFLEQRVSEIEKIIEESQIRPKKKLDSVLKQSLEEY